jgi:hypothetical protein
MKRYTLDPKNLPQFSKTDLARIDRMKDRISTIPTSPSLAMSFFQKKRSLHLNGAPARRVYATNSNL